MILYSIVDSELLSEELENTIITETEEIKYQGINMSVQRLKDGTTCIVRVNSTDPQVYLQPELAPGNIIT